MNQGNGPLASAVNYHAGAYPSSAAAADLNNDGKVDLAVVNGTNGAGATPGTVSILLTTCLP